METKFWAYTFCMYKKLKIDEYFPEDNILRVHRPSQVN